MGVYDDYWHAQYGIDTTVLTPPHMLTLFGGIIAEIASVLMVLALMKENNSNFKGLDLLLYYSGLCSSIVHFYFSIT